MGLIMSTSDTSTTQKECLCITEHRPLLLSALNPRSPAPPYAFPFAHSNPIWMTVNTFQEFPTWQGYGDGNFRLPDWFLWPDRANTEQEEKGHANFWP